MLLGDLNDSPATDPIRALVGRGGLKLKGLRPYESRGESVPNHVLPKGVKRGVSWTYFYAKEDQYNRFDYILASQGIFTEYVASYVKAQSDWGVASDHRIVVAKFTAKDR